jgi:formylglycine-generating enzyme required for sulfatase activity
MKKFFTFLLVVAIIAGIYYFMEDDGNPPGGGSDIENGTGNNSGTDDKAKSFTVNGVSFNMVKVKGGTFFMLIVIDHVPDRSPYFQVKLSDYYIGQTEVTQALWQAVMGNNPSGFKGDMNRPVENVSWNDCQMFVTKLSRMTGQRFRLPKETEWEYAARGGNRSNDYKYAGSNNIDAVAWYSNNSNGTTHPVATKSSNELGLYDMSGNVWEWVHDCYMIGGDSESNQNSGSDKVLRGSSWANNYTLSRRFTNNPMNSSKALGLRLAL